MHPVFGLTLGYFFVGGVAIRVINRGSSAAERRERWNKFGVYFLVVHFVIAAILAGDGYFFALAATLVALGLAELARAVTRKAAGRLERLIATLLPYAALSFAFLQFARRTSPELILFVYVVVLTFDGFSQITGQLFGRHKLAPRLSPRKTVEGLVGGLAMVGLTALLLSGWTGIGRGRTVGLALLVAVCALGGDLAASRVKRASGVKDYGGMIPGHGGILDRFDSFIAAGAVYWAVFVR